MRLLVFLFILLQTTCSVYSEVCESSDTCNKGSNNTDSNSEILNSNSFIHHLVNTAAGIDFDSSRCRHELSLIKEGIREKDLWASKLLDASAKPASGFISGNNFWLGSSEQCRYVSNKIDFHLSTRFKRNTIPSLFSEIAPFEVEMRYVYVKHTSPTQVQFRVMVENTLHLGLCLPKSCTNDQIHHLAQTFFNDSVGVNEFGPQSNVLRVKDLKIHPRFLLKKTVLGFLFVVIAITHLRQMATKMKKNRAFDENNNAVQISENELNLTLVEIIVKCFSSRQKFEISKKKSVSATVNSISGLRSISCYLIVITHVLVFSHFALHNKVSYLEGGETFLGLFLTNSALLVDGFFAISGYLAASNFLKDSSLLVEIRSNKINKNAVLFGKMMLHRYIRLTPVFIMSMLSSEVISFLLDSSSVYELTFRDDLNCPKYWWRNILYIHNLFPKEKMCVSWSWSLGCEMQFFALTTAVLFVYVKHAKLGEKLLKALFASVTIFSYVIHVKYGFSLELDVMDYLLSTVYSVPWTRIGPYLMGTFTAILLEKNNGKLALETKTRSALWLCCWLVLVIVMVGLLFKNSSSLLASFMMVSAHLEVGFVFCWIIVFDVSGYHNYLIRFLSQKFFVRVAKTTYPMYLLSPIITMMIYGLMQTGSTFRFPEIVIMSYVIIKIAAQTSIWFTVYFEVPFGNMSKFILPKEPSPEKTK